MGFGTLTEIYVIYKGLINGSLYSERSVDTTIMEWNFFHVATHITI